MSCRVGLSIGDSFAEVRGFSIAPSNNSPENSSKNKPAHGTNEPLVQSRWYLPKKSLADGLREALEKLGDAGESGTLFVSTTVVDRARERKIGQSPAVIVTSGFESWLKINQKITSPIFTNHPTRSSLPTDDDHVFAVNARMSADGQVDTALSVEELEFLAAKLEMMEVENIALTFLHSRTNPELEVQASRYLTEKGFRVFMSHRCAGETEVQRWTEAVEAAYAEPAAADEREQIETALKTWLGDKRDSWHVQFWNHFGLQPESEFATLSARGGACKALTEHTPQMDADTMLHFGLENFFLLKKSPQGVRSHVMGICPTQLIALKAWPLPTLDHETCGYEPGPMLFGKSHDLAVLDVFFVNGSIPEIEGFSPYVSERSRARILESLFTLGKSMPRESSAGRIDASDIARDLQALCIEKIAIELAKSGASGKVALTGPLAPVFAPFLKTRRPDLKFSSGEAASWFEADSCLPTQLEEAP